MKRGGIAILVLLFLFSCNSTQQENRFTIEGDTGTPQGEVYLYGTDSRCDTVFTALCDEEGFFRLTVPLKKTTPFALITPGKQYLQVYGEPGLTATLQKDTAYSQGWRISGGCMQALHDSISMILDTCTSAKKLHEKIDSFILKYPINDVNIEIIRRYMTELPEVDDKDTRTRIGKLGGILQDHGFLTELKAKTDGKTSNIKHRSFPAFTRTTIDSIEITQQAYAKKYTLVTFWATWDEESRKRMRMLAGIRDSIKSESFAILNIALDYDSAAWRKFIQEDSIAGDNIMEENALDSQLAKQFKIKSLPFTMLVNPYQRIQEYNVNFNGITEHLDTLASNYDKSQEKRAKEKEKKNKKKR